MSMPPLSDDDHRQAETLAHDLVDDIFQYRVHCGYSHRVVCEALMMLTASALIEAKSFSVDGWPERIAAYMQMLSGQKEQP